MQSYYRNGIRYFTICYNKLGRLQIIWFGSFKKVFQQSKEKRLMLVGHLDVICLDKAGAYGTRKAWLMSYHCQQNPVAYNQKIP